MDYEKVAVVVNTHAAYVLPMITCLDSLDKHWPGPIRVVVGGAATVAEKQVGQVSFQFVTHNSFDYTAMIEYVRAPQQTTHVIFLHDTMEVGQNFDQLLVSADPDDEVTAVFGGQCNLALYRTDYLYKRQHEIVALTNCSKKQAIDAENFLVRTAKRVGNYPGTAVEDREEVFPFGAPRIKVYYSGLDIVKWKANYGQTHEGSYILKP